MESDIKKASDRSWKSYQMTLKGYQLDFVRTLPNKVSDEQKKKK